MMRSKRWLRGWASPTDLAAAIAASLCLAAPAFAQPALPTVAMPTLPAVAQQPPATYGTPWAPALQAVPQRLDASPVLQNPAVQQTLQLPNAVLTAPSPLLARPAVPVQSVSGAAAGLSASATLPDRRADLVPLQQLRATTVHDLLLRHADVLEADPLGEPMRRQELLWVSPAPARLQAALALGFVVVRDNSLPELNLRDVVLRPPVGMATAQALVQLRALGPDVEVDFNHIYIRSGDAAAGRLSAARANAAGTSPQTAAGRRVGLVDGGIDNQHVALRGATVHLWGCGGAVHPSVHGTAVASLLIGRDTTFAGASAGATLYAADIYCGQPAGGAADAIALALAWMARENVAVVNISLVGPSNRLLERAVQAMVLKGYLLVAAVGNDGPAAPPLFPAAYAGVVGVTGVSHEQRVLPEAAQGPQVMFSALGAGVAVAQPGGGYSLARGTSFAAPQVAGLLAQSMGIPDAHAASAAVARLADSAVDLGAPGRDPVFGFGLVGANSAPGQVNAPRR